MSPDPRSEKAAPHGRLRDQDLLIPILESIGDGFVSVDEKWRFTYVNRQAETFLDHPMGALLGRSLWEAFPETADTAFAAQFQRAAAEQAEVAFEEFYAPLDKWFEVRAFPFHGGLSILFRDVSERRQQTMALRESEERYRSLVENIDLGITLIDENHRILMTNAAQGRMFDKPVSAFLHRHCYREFEKREAACSHCPGTRAMASGRPEAVETMGTRDDGSRFTVRIQAFPVFDEDGVARKFIEVVEDVSSRRQAEEALRQSEERFRSIFENAGAGMATISTDGHFLQVNRAFCRFVGYSARELCTQTVADLTHPDDLPRTQRFFAEALAGQRRNIHYEKRYLHKNGSIVWGNVSSAWVTGADGRPRYAIGLIQDTTQRKEAEEQLRRALRETAAARDRIDGILKSVSDGLLVTDRGERLTHFNPAAETLLGRSLAPCLDRPVAELPLAPELVRELRAPLPPDGSSRQCELTLAAPQSGPERILQVRTAPFFDVAGNRVGTITSLRDVSREREIDLIKSEFISTAAHELRTPLTAVLGFGELLQQAPWPAGSEQRDYVDSICEKAEILSGIIDDLLDLSRIESGRLISLNREGTSLAELLTSIVDQYRSASPRHRFELQLPAQDPWPEVDREKILQVMENLLSNAVKYSPAGGPVTVSATVAEGLCRIAVRDRGIGMTADQVDRVFDKFYRADTSNTAVSGLGLGMTIVRKIIAAHAGEIRVASEPDTGTVVEFSLPLGGSDGKEE